MPKATNGDIRIEYDAFGPASGEAVLLINGLGSQMTRWPEAFIDRLVELGLAPVRFDNRDAGLSDSTEGRPGYTLSDMATDGAAVLDAVGRRDAHIVGLSMGGMIAQEFVCLFPGRTRSLTSIMSSTGRADLPPPTPAAMETLMTRGPAPDDPGYIDDCVRRARVIGSPAYPWPEGALAARARAELARAYNPAGVARQMEAIRSSGDRRARIAKITAPTVVLHGADDPLVPVAAGEDTAASIPGAELRIVPGMGHDMPPSLYDVFVAAIATAVARGRAAVA